MRIRIAMDKLPRHVKGTFYCEECDRVYPIRYMDRHHRTYKHQTQVRYGKGPVLKIEQNL